jgi:hypothetical protein
MKKGRAMNTRRQFLKDSAVTAGTVAITAAIARSSTAAAAGGTASDIARDEAFWATYRKNYSSSTPVGHACGDRGAWDPPATTPVQAMVCDTGVADADEDDDDDRLVFAAPPGLEYTTVSDDCVTHGGGLRIAR